MSSSANGESKANMRSRTMPIPLECYNFTFREFVGFHESILLKIQEVKQKGDRPPLRELLFNEQMRIKTLQMIYNARKVGSLEGRNPDIEILL